MIRRSRPMRRAMLRTRATLGSGIARLEARFAAPVVTLDTVRRRLELFLAALHGRSFAIEAADNVAPPGWFRRHVLHRAERQAPSDALPTSDGERILLPRALHDESGEAGAVAQYRLFALQQAERIVRGTIAGVPHGVSLLEHDLYRVSEAVAVDALLERTIHHVGPALAAARTAELRHRRRPLRSSAAEREVERLVRAALAGDRALLPDAAAPADSVTWARATAARIGGAERYDGIAPVRYWGSLRASGPAPRVMTEAEEVLQNLQPTGLPIPGAGSQSRPGARGESQRATPGEPGSGRQADITAGSLQWVRGNGGAPETSDGGDSPSTAERPPRPPRDAGREDPALSEEPRVRDDAEPARRRGGIFTQYPEWDHVTGRYRERGATVYTIDPLVGDPDWAASVFREHAVLIRQVRQRFERLRASRLRSGQQLDGEELDIAACVRAAVDMHRGIAPDDRVYMTTRSMRHPLAIGLLADVSGSTRAIVTDPVRMIDIEKVALLLASEALSSLGDRYALFAFAGRGAHGVEVKTLKNFSDPAGTAVHGRIAGLEAGGFTRLGAAARHATAALQREPARHRLLLILSDGRPNDNDEYMSSYGVEDSRQAMAEARVSGVYPFCLNVDDVEEEGSEYLQRIFGPAGFTSLRRPEQLPHALLQAVRTLIKS